VVEGRPSGESERLWNVNVSGVGEIIVGVGGDAERDVGHGETQIVVE
jgi:hypothetical protein